MAKKNFVFPLPWRIDYVKSYHCILVHDGEGAPISSFHGSHNKKGELSVKAHQFVESINIMEAAHELYSVCKDALDRFLTLEDADEATPRDIAVRKKLEAAIMNCERA